MDVPFTGDAETDESTNISRGIATQGLPVVNMPDPTRTKNANQPYQKSGLHPITPRPSAENSVVLPHHRPARDGSIKPGKTGDSVAAVASTLSPRRESPGDRRNSEPSKWFDHSNQHATTTLDARAMDVEPPFFQKETDSSNEERPKGQPGFGFDPPKGAPPALRPTVTHSSSADDYRSVIDDLTVEIQQLKEELKRYKQLGPDLLKKEKLFEIKVHGLPKRKKRELEATLRDFAASLEGTPSAQASSSRKKRHGKGTYAMSSLDSKHASSSSGSHSRPADSAYASISTGPNSSGTSLGKQSMSSRTQQSEPKVEDYLKDVPQGLLPRHVVMTDKEKKKLVVRRLEQLFTGKISGKNTRGIHTAPATGAATLVPVMVESRVGAAPITATPSPNPEACREARILPQDGSTKKSRSRDNGSISNSNGDQTDSGGNGGSGNGNGNGNGNVDGNGNGTNSSPPTCPPPEQRPTRPLDLDPDRVQIPSENMEYIRHLGLAPPELLPKSKTAEHVLPDADGWVYLNLLCNLAQLHMINVTPSFIRAAVSEKSTKFQLSPDGRKIRWRGGTDGTRFSSDSSPDNSQNSPSTDETDSLNHRKKQKTQHSSGEATSAAPSKNPSKFGPQLSGSSDSFHYKPLFVHRSTSLEQTSLDDTGSSFGAAEDSNVGESGWDQSGTGSSQRKKRRLDGAIIYYSGAPFCTDLSGDPGDISPATYMASSGQEQPTSPPGARIQMGKSLPILQRSSSGSLLGFRPLSDGYGLNQQMDIDRDTAPELTENDSDTDDASDSDFPWSDSQQHINGQQLEPCGLGGVVPDDHFRLLVQTCRSKDEEMARHARPVRSRSYDAADRIISHLATMPTSPRLPRPARPVSRSTKPPVEIEYLETRVKHLAPAPLPPPATFFPPFGTDSSEGESDDWRSDDDDGLLESSEEFMSRRANPHHSDNTYPEDEDFTSADEEGGEPDEDESVGAMDLDAGKDAKESEASSGGGVMALKGNSTRRSSGSAAVVPPTSTRGRSKSVDLLRRTGSSMATAGGASGYTGSDEES